MVTRPLSHVRSNWELTENKSGTGFRREEDSYAEPLNQLFAELDELTPPEKYHANEDKLALYLVKKCSWNIVKDGNKWRMTNGEKIDYALLIEQGCSGRSENVQEMKYALVGRMVAAQDRGQHRFDQMEKHHRKIFAAAISVVLFHSN